MEWLWRLLRCDEDSLREQRIDLYRRRMEAAESRTERRYYFALMSGEIADRSPRQVKRMERERGLA